MRDALRFGAVTVVLFFVGGWVGCTSSSDSGNGDDDANGSNVGEEGGACYSNGTCDTGLVCNASDICERTTRDTGSHPDAGESDVPVEVTEDAPTVDVVDTIEEVVVPIDVVSDSASPGDWPPADPWYEGRTCQLPTCDPDATIDFDPSGLWTRTLTTVSTDCHEMMVAFDERLQEGYQEVTEHEALSVVGGCSYQDGPDSTVTGVIVGDTEIFCDIDPDDDGVYVVITGQTTYSGDAGEGTSHVFLFDLPMSMPDCSIQYTHQMERE